VNFATSKNLRIKSGMFPHPNIGKYTWTFPIGKTHNLIDHLLVDRRRHSSELYIRFRAADCDTDHYLVRPVEVSNRFAALEALDTEVEINSTWKTIRDKIKISAKESLGYCDLMKRAQK
jgi:hypothetical protein